MEAAAVRCTLGEISCTLENILGRHISSSPVISGSYIASFRGGGGGGGNKVGVKRRDDNDNNDDNYKEHDDKEHEEDEGERQYRFV